MTEVPEPGVGETRVDVVATFKAAAEARAKALAKKAPKVRSTLQEGRRFRVAEYPLLAGLLADRP